MLKNHKTKHEKMWIWDGVRMHSQDQRGCLPDACKWLIKGSSFSLDSFVKGLTSDDVIARERWWAPLTQGVSPWGSCSWAPTHLPDWFFFLNTSFLCTHTADVLMESSTRFQNKFEIQGNLEAGEITLPLPCLSQLPFFFFFSLPNRVHCLAR